VDATLCITTDAEGRSSHHLKEGLNREGITFTLDPKSEDGTSNIAYIQFTGSTGTGDPALWENGDFVVHMTFQFSIHRDPDQDRAVSKLKKASDLNTSLQDAGLNTAPSDPEPVLTSETIPDSETPLSSAPSEAFKTTVLERDSGPGGGSVSENDLIDLP
jgi:hypothetical protein